MWNPKVRSARHLPRFEPGPNILLWVREWDGAVPIPAIVQPKPLWSGKHILSVVIPCGIRIHRSPDPKSFNLICDDGMMIENGGVIFGITEKKTVGASQDGLVHVVFVKTGPIRLGYSCPGSRWSSNSGYSIMAFVSVLVTPQ